MAEETVLADVPIDHASVPMREFKKAREAGEATVKAAPVAEVDEKEEDSEETTDDKPKVVIKGGFQKRIDRLIKHSASLEEENAKLKEQLAKGTKDEPKGSEKQVAANGEPQRESFGTDIEYMKALVRWEMKQEQENDRLKEAAADRKEIVNAYNRRALELQAQHGDYNEVVGKNTEPIPSKVAQVIFEDLENGPDVCYFLGKHPEICQEMMEVGPRKAVAMAWKISEQLAPGEKKDDEEVDEKEEAKVKVTSKAPPPIKPVNSGSTKSSVPIDRMSMADYKKARAAGRIS